MLVVGVAPGTEQLAWGFSQHPTKIIISVKENGIGYLECTCREILLFTHGITRGPQTCLVTTVFTVLPFGLLEIRWI